MTRRLYNHKNNINKKSSGIKREQASVNKAYIHHKSCHRRYQNRERYYYIWYKNQTAESGTPDGRDGMNHPWMKVGVGADCLRCSAVWFCTIRVLSDAGNLPFFLFLLSPLLHLFDSLGAFYHHHFSLFSSFYSSSFSSSSSYSSHTTNK